MIEIERVAEAVSRATKISVADLCRPGSYDTRLARDVTIYLAVRDGRSGFDAVGVAFDLSRGDVVQGFNRVSVGSRLKVADVVDLLFIAERELEKLVST